MRDVQIHALRAAAFHFGVDRPGHDVAGGQFALGMGVLHETLAATIDQNAAFASNRLGNEKRFDRGMVKAGRVELNEFHVRDHGTCPPGHCHSVAGRDIGVCRVEVNLPAPARGQHGDIAAEGFDHAGNLVEHIDAQATVLPRVAELAGGDEIHGHVVLHHLDFRMRGDLLQKAVFDLAARGIAGVKDAAFRVSTFATEVGFHRSVAVLTLVEMHAKSGQFGDAGGAFGDDRFDDLLAAKSRAGRESVLDMEVEGILVAHHASHAALRPGGVRVRCRAFRDKRHRAFLRGFQCEGEASNAAAENDEIEFPHAMTGRAMLSIRRAFPRKTAAARRPSVRRLRRGCNVVASTAST